MIYFTPDNQVFRKIFMRKGFILFFSAYALKISRESGVEGHDPALSILHVPTDIHAMDFKMGRGMESHRKSSPIRTILNSVNPCPKTIPCRKIHQLQKMPPL